MCAVKSLLAILMFFLSNFIAALSPWFGLYLIFIMHPDASQSSFYVMHNQCNETRVWSLQIGMKSIPEHATRHHKVSSVGVTSTCSNRALEECSTANMGVVILLWAKFQYVWDQVCAFSKTVGASTCRDSKCGPPRQYLMRSGHMWREM